MKDLADCSWPTQKLRRDRNREAGRCINENQNGTHGPATHGVRCERCAKQHRRSR